MRSGFLDEANYVEQDDGTDGCHDDSADITACGYSYEAKKIPSDYCANDANDNVAYETVAFTF